MLIQIVNFIVGLAGVISISFGFYQLSEPAGYICAGVFGLIYSFLGSGGAQLFTRGSN